MQIIQIYIYIYILYIVYKIMLLLYMLAIVHITFSVCVNLKERGTTDVFVFIQCPEELRRVALNFSALVATIVMDISPFHPARVTPRSDVIVISVTQISHRFF